MGTAQPDDRNKKSECLPPEVSQLFKDLHPEEEPPKVRMLVGGDNPRDQILDEMRDLYRDLYPDKNGLPIRQPVGVFKVRQHEKRAKLLILANCYDELAEFGEYPKIPDHVAARIKVLKENISFLEKELGI